MIRVIADWGGQGNCPIYKFFNDYSKECETFILSALQDNCKVILENTTLPLTNGTFIDEINSKKQ